MSGDPICTLCRFQSKQVVEHRNGVMACKSTSRCRHRLLQRCAAMRRVGNQMSNLCFNLAQQSGRKLTDQLCEDMRKLREEWDRVR